MSVLTLRALRVLDEQEGGGDEIYFRFADNGSGGTGKTSVFEGLDTGDYRSISGSFSFTGSVKVTMYEDDTLSDDYVQTQTLSSYSGYHSITFQESGMKYVLDYHVL
jgi:hypothetical protein